MECWNILRDVPTFDKWLYIPAQWQYSPFVLAVVAVTNRGDIDNLAGSVLDALNGMVWQDDKQVTHLVVRVVRGRKPAEAGLTAGIWEIEE